MLKNKNLKCKSTGKIIHPSKKKHVYSEAQMQQNVKAQG
jgi:hypothetical protein